MRIVALSKVCKQMQTSASTSLLISEELRVSSRILVANSLLVDVTLSVAGVAVSGPWQAALIHIEGVSFSFHSLISFHAI
jgi:hypothetical protein